MHSLRIDRLGLAFVLLWASGYVVGSVATSEVAPLAVNLWRYVVGTFVFCVLARCRHERLPRSPRLLALAAVTGLLAFGLQFSGLYIGMAQGVPAATTALVACSAPLFVAVAGVALRWDHLARRQWAGVGVGVVGVVVTLGDRVARPPHPASLLFTLLGLVGLVLGSLGQSRLAGRSGPNALLAVQMAAATLALAVVAPLRGSVAVPLDLTAAWSMTWMAVVSGVVGPLLLFTLIHRRGPAAGTSLLFAVPAVTALVAWPVLGEPFGPTAVLGLLVAGAGLVLLRRQPRPKEQAEAVPTAPLLAPPGR